MMVVQCGALVVRGSLGIVVWQGVAAIVKEAEDKLGAGIVLGDE